ncbi:hypothetical protein [Streptomyces sp. NPDC002851]
MSLQEDLTAVQRSLDDLARAVGRLEQSVGEGPDIRRVRSDTDHLRASITLLRQNCENSTAARHAERREMIPVPDKPYDSSKWTDVDDEGLGARDRHAP